jgi:hypothetical protein
VFHHEEERVNETIPAYPARLDSLKNTNLTGFAGSTKAAQLQQLIPLGMPRQVNPSSRYDPQVSPVPSAPPVVLNALTRQARSGRFSIRGDSAGNGGRSANIWSV